MDLMQMLRTLLTGSMDDIVGPAPEAQARLKQIQATRMARENKNMMQVGPSLLGAGAGTRGAEISDLANQAKGAGGFGAGRP